MFVDELNSRLNVSKPPPLSRYAAQTYDAVWAMALSLNGAEIKWKQWKQNNSSTIQPQLDHFDYTRYDMALEFFHQFSRLNFLGVSVCIDFANHIAMSISNMTIYYLYLLFVFIYSVYNNVCMRLCEVNRQFYGFFSTLIELAKCIWVDFHLKHPNSDFNIDFSFLFSTVKMSCCVYMLYGANKVPQLIFC